MTFRLISLYMGSPLSRIGAIIYDHVFPRFPRPVDIFMHPVFLFESK